MLLCFRTFVTVLALSLVGCSGPQLEWQKRGASTADMQRDAYECERDTRTAAASFSGGLQGAGEAQAFYGRCLTARGYSLAAPASLSGPPPPPVQPTPMRDAAGNTYQDGDRVKCSFSNGSTVTFGAKVCAQGGGLIVGRAI